VVARTPRLALAALLGEHGELGEHDVHVWVVPLDDPDKKRRRELAHIARGRVLGAYLGVTPATLGYERSPSGKPRLRRDELQFNLSHSERLALLAVSRALPVGIDVQAPHPAVSKPWFAKRICAPREYERWLSDPRPELLLRLWARKEATLKARGEGSYVAVSDLDVLDDEVEGGWRCLDLTLPQAPGYHAAVTVRDAPGVAVAVFEFSWS
jgi:4'-phosphopantetheinyl transferase